MSFFVGAGLWAAVALAIGAWSRDADRRWQQALTERGEMPEGPDDIYSGALRPFSFFRRRLAYLSAGYPRPLRTTDSGTETWRLRRSRRRRIFFFWMFGGAVVAIAIRVILDAAQTDAWWIALLFPIAAMLAYLGRTAYAYGNGFADDAMAAPEP